MSFYLVTGGAGFIGANLVRELQRRRQRVRVLDNLSAGRPENLPAGRAIDFQRGDVRDEMAVKMAMRDVDYVIHLAAVRPVEQSVDDPQLVNDVNVSGTMRVLWAAKEARIKRVVLASSSAVYGAVAKTVNRETDRPQPASPYAVTKLAGEEYAQVFGELYGLGTVALRYFNVYGPWQDPRSKYALVVPLFLQQLLAGERPCIHWDGYQARDFVFVDDVVSATLAAAQAPGATAGAVYNVGSGQATSINRLLQTLQNLLGTEITPRRGRRRLGDVRRTRADIRQVRRALKWRPAVSLRDGLQRSIDWYKLQTYEETGPA